MGTRTLPMPVDRGYETVCLIYAGKLNQRGYAHNRFRRDWERLHGPIPPGHELDHKCRQRDCINLDHLEVVTKHENMRRSSIARAAASDNPVAQLRAKAGLTQGDLALAVGVSRSLVSHWERGGRIPEPHLSNLRELAEGYGHTPEPTYEQPIGVRAA